MNITEADASPRDLLAEDPTIQLDGIPDDANGPTPEPFERYGQPLPKEWIPLYRKPMRTPSRKLRVVGIGAGISCMNLAYKIYHEHNLIDKDIVSDLCIYEANEEMGGTWLVNTYPGVACDVSQVDGWKGSQRVPATGLVSEDLQYPPSCPSRS